MSKILKDRTIKNGIIVPIDLKLNEEGKIIRVTEEYIDISYASKESGSRVLSNLYKCEFNYFENNVDSIEAVIQSLKYEDEEIRKTCFGYSGVDAWHLRGLDPYSWQKEGNLYTPVGPVNRYKEEYQDFLDELYLMAFQNPLYRNNLKNTKDKKLDHVIGEDNIKLTTLTRTEYISRLYALRYCIKNEIVTKEEKMKTLKKVRSELKCN